MIARLRAQLGHDHECRRPACDRPTDDEHLMCADHGGHNTAPVRDGHWNRLNVKGRHRSGWLNRGGRRG